MIVPIVIFLLSQATVKPMSSEMNAVADYQSSESETEVATTDQSTSSNRRPKKTIVWEKIRVFPSKEEAISFIEQENT